MKYPRVGEIYHEPMSSMAGNINLVGRTWHIIGLSKSTVSGETLVSYTDAEGNDKTPYTCHISYFMGENGNQARFVSVYPDDNRPDIQGDTHMRMQKHDQAYIGPARLITDESEDNFLTSMDSQLADYLTPGKTPNEQLCSVMNMVRCAATLCHQRGWPFNQAWSRLFAHDMAGDDSVLDFTDIATPPTEN